MYSFDENSLLLQLNGLPAASRVAFAVAAATRQIRFCLRRFPKVMPLDQKQSNEVLAQIWLEISGKAVANIASNELLAKVMSAMPEEGEDWTIADSLVDDALSTLAYAIRCLISGEAQEAVWAVRRSYEAVDQVAIRILDASPGVRDDEDRILSHEVVQLELARQVNDMKLLSDGLIEEVKRLAFSDDFIQLDEWIMIS